MSCGRSLILLGLLGVVAVRGCLLVYYHCESFAVSQLHDRADCGGSRYNIDDIRDACLARRRYSLAYNLFLLDILGGSRTIAIHS